jgi:hypothetical protein
MDQQRQSKVETSQKNARWLVSVPLLGCRKNRIIQNLQRPAYPRHREEGPTSVRRWYKRARFRSSDIDIWHRCRRCQLGFLEFGLAEFDDGAETLSSAHSHSWLRAFTQGLNRNTNFRSEVPRFPRSEPKIPMLVGTIQEGGDGDRSQGCTGPRGRTVREDQARSVSQAGVTSE